MEYYLEPDNHSVLVKRVATQDGDYNETEVEEGPRFSRSKAKNRSSSTISKKTPRNSGHSKFRLSRGSSSSGIDTLLNKRLTESNSHIRPPSSQRSQRSFMSNFSIHHSNLSRMKNDVSRCNIPKPHNYSFREYTSRSNMMDISANTDKYTLLKSDYESLKEELGQRNATILKMQIEIKEMKENFIHEKDQLISKIENANNSTSQSYEDLRIKLEAVIKENEELSKKLYLRDLENKQNMINKNHEIKKLNKQVIALQEKCKAERTSFNTTREKYKTGALKLQEKHKDVVDNLKNRIQMLENSHDAHKPLKSVQPLKDKELPKRTKKFEN